MMRIVTLDFETYYSKEFSLSKMTTESYIRDDRFQVIGFAYKIDDGPATWVTGNDMKIATKLHELDIPNAYLITHNAAFDGAILAWRYNIIPKFYIDTLSMARPVTGLTVGGSLDKLTKHFGLGTKGTEVVNALGLRREDFPPAQLYEYGNYCKNDTELTYKLYHVLRKYNPPKELYIQDLMLRMFTDPVLELDAELLTHHFANVKDKKQKLLDRIDATVGKDALMSNPKFAAVLKTLGVEPPTKISLKTQKEAYAFGKTDPAFKALLEHADPKVQAVVAARLGVKSTLEETRTESFLGIASRGQLPILLNYWGAHTGRASGGDKMNLQNLPRGGSLRKSIKAPEGHVMVAPDSSQIEARVVAWLAGQKDLTQDFRNKEDIYSKFASDVYGRKVDRKLKAIHPETGKEYSPDFAEGFVGKTCILGLGYGMGAEKFKTALKSGGNVEVTIDEAQKIVNLYRRKYALIADLWKGAANAIDKMAHGFETTFGVGIEIRCTPEGVHLPNGTMIRYPELRFDHNEKQYLYSGRYGPVRLYGPKMVENVVQALARIVVFDQMARIDQQLRTRDEPGRRHKIALTVHDEVVAVIPEDFADEALEMCLKEMSIPPRWCADLPVACEGGIARTYGDAK